MTARNVIGTELVPCSYDPLTGFYRDGCCQTDAHDHGTHVVCARMKSTHSKALDQVSLNALQAHAAD